MPPRHIRGDVRNALVQQWRAACTACAQSCHVVGHDAQGLQRGTLRSLCVTCTWAWTCGTSEEGRVWERFGLGVGGCRMRRWMAACCNHDATRVAAPRGDLFGCGLSAARRVSGDACVPVSALSRGFHPGSSVAARTSMSMDTHIAPPGPAWDAFLCPPCVRVRGAPHLQCQYDDTHTARCV